MRGRFPAVVVFSRAFLKSVGLVCSGGLFSSLQTTRAVGMVAYSNYTKVGAGPLEEFRLEKWKVEKLWLQIMAECGRGKV